MSNKNKLILITFVICCLIVVAAVLRGKSDGPAGPSPAVPTAEAQPQNALTEIALEAGYGIGGMPWYDAQLGRWMMSASVPGCKVKVVLGGNKGPEAQVPDELWVLSIGDYRQPDSAPLTALAAEDLKRNPEWHRLLDCV